eukprot:626-Hanusia_phi.AAC.1
MSPQLKYYHKKKAENDWYLKEKERLRESTLRRYHQSDEYRKQRNEKHNEYYKNRYKSDEVFREQEKKKALERYYKRKEASQAN